MPAGRKTHRGSGKKFSGALNNDVNTERPRAPPSTYRGARDTQVNHNPSEADIVKAVSSLYEDRLKPFSRILRKRLVEQFQASRGTQGKDCNASWLRNFCKECPRLEIQSENGGEWCVLLRNKPGDFVDFHDSQDPYPEELWQSMRAFADRLGQEEDFSLPGGRYSSACDLMNRQLSFLSGYSLGEVCHIVELAISQRNIFGYSNGAIVPYELSTSMLKSACARDQRALVSDGDGTRAVSVDLETARNKLREILDSSLARGMQQVPLSNVKRLFRSLYDLELSETALGHSKLTDLLQDTQFSDICEVQLQERGYVVLPVPSHGNDARGVQDSAQHLDSTLKADKLDDEKDATREPSYTGSSQYFMESTFPKSRRSHSESFGSNSSDEETHKHNTAQSRSPQNSERVQFCPDEPLCLELAEVSESLVLSPVYPFPLGTPSPHCSQAPVSDDSTTWHATCLALGFAPYEVDSLDDDTCNSSSDTDSTDHSRFCSLQPLRIEGIGQSDTTKTPLMAFDLPTPSPVHSYNLKSCTQPKIVEPTSVQGITRIPVISNPFFGTWKITCDALGMHSQNEHGLDYAAFTDNVGEPATQRLRFCEDEPLSFDSVDIENIKEATTSPFPLMTPTPRYAPSCEVSWPKHLCSNGSIHAEGNDVEALARWVPQASLEELSSTCFNVAELPTVCPKSSDVPVLRIASFL